MRCGRLLQVCLPELWHRFSRIAGERRQVKARAQHCLVYKWIRNNACNPRVSRTMTLHKQENLEELHRC